MINIYGIVQSVIIPMLIVYTRAFQNARGAAVMLSGKIIRPFREEIQGDGFTKIFNFCKSGSH